MLNQYQPLFLKYRPQALNQLAGQTQVAITLTNAIKYERISHAYLFTGPRGTGKTSTARIFAKSLNCEQGPTINPCHICTSCLEIKQGISPSVFEIDAASNNSVDDARLLIERAPLSACGGRFKLYIIDECHMLTKEAFNALLKTIEEPPASVIFILATTEEHKVPATIVSRCQKLIFRLINDETMISHLNQIAGSEKIAIDSEAITAIARRASGGLRDALSLLDQVSLLGLDGQTVSTQDVLLLTGALPEDILITLSKHILKKESNQTLSLLQELLADGREAHLIAAELAKHMLNIAKATYLANQTSPNIDELKTIGGSSKYKKALFDLAKLVDQHELVQIVEEMDRLEITCRRATQPVMNLEIGLLSLCHRLDILSLKTIQNRLAKLENNASLNPPKEVIPSIPAIEEESNYPQEQKSNFVPEKESISVAEAPSHFDQRPDHTDTLSNGDIDICWQNILTELQRRHLPTFSLVSTHAFPVSVADKVLTVGVLVENFQKMIENKVDHIKAAAVICQLDPDLSIRVKVMAENENKRKSQTQSSAARSVTRLVNGDDVVTDEKVNVLSQEQHHETAAKEAYRLFEGPGSRFIAPNQ